jgi:hypothetical protein
MSIVNRQTIVFQKLLPIAQWHVELMSLKSYWEDCCLLMAVIKASSVISVNYPLIYNSDDEG